MRKIFKGRAILPANLNGEALVSRRGFNTYASFYNSLQDDVTSAVCADNGNKELFGIIMTGKIICLPKTIGSTSAGAVWQRVASLGVAPKALLFAHSIDSLAAGGLIVAEIWTHRRICTVDQLGEDFLLTVRDADWLEVYNDGTVKIGNSQKGPDYDDPNIPIE
jgi:predicted aconitase with swiveling domain